MLKTRITAILILLVGLAFGYFVFSSEPRLRGEESSAPKFISNFPFHLGLDLSGGTHLVYRADVSSLGNADVKEALYSLRDVIERRVNLFGVSEPLVTVENPGFANQGEHRLTVDLPGVTDVGEAVAMIGQTPLLQFKVERPELRNIDNSIVDENGQLNLDFKDPYIDTELTGRYLDHATLDFDPTTRQPVVSLVFNQEGAKLFEKITSENVGRTVAIYLDGAPISTPVVNEAITGGQAQITGQFTPQEAKQLVGRLNSGALPVPIELISTQSIGATLGQSATNAGVKAGIIGFLAISIFLILWYRLSGIIAVIALLFYTSLVLTLFKLIPVTLTAAGIAGFIVSLGIAVDANVLIFERIKEEIRNGGGIKEAMHTGFVRAWQSIRDSNLSTLITALILYWFGTSLIKGFALTLGIGVLVSMLSAIVVSRILLYSLGIQKNNMISRFLLGSGLSNAKK